MEAALSSSLGRTILGTSIVTIGRARDNGIVVSDLNCHTCILLSMNYHKRILSSRASPGC